MQSQWQVAQSGQQPPNVILSPILIQRSCINCLNCRRYKCYSHWKIDHTTSLNWTCLLLFALFLRFLFIYQLLYHGRYICLQWTGERPPHTCVVDLKGNTVLVGNYSAHTVHVRCFRPEFSAGFTDGISPHYIQILSCGLKLFEDGCAILIFLRPCGAGREDLDAFCESWKQDFSSALLTSWVKLPSLIYLSIRRMLNCAFLNWWRSVVISSLHSVSTILM